MYSREFPLKNILDEGEHTQLFLAEQLTDFSFILSLVALYDMLVQSVVVNKSLQSTMLKKMLHILGTL